MSRGAGLCKRCGGPKRGRSGRVAWPVAQCSQCGDEVCARHCIWDTDRYLCTKCAKAAGIKPPP